MKEYKILCEDFDVAQRKLNQWRHQYHLEIIHLEVIHNSPNKHKIVILLTREKKTENQQEVC